MKRPHAHRLRESLDSFKRFAQARLISKTWDKEDVNRGNSQLRRARGGGFRSGRAVRLRQQDIKAAQREERNASHARRPARPGWFRNASVGGAGNPSMRGATDFEITWNEMC